MTKFASWGAVGAAAAALITLGAWYLPRAKSGGSMPERRATPAGVSESVLFAAPGRVEGLSRTTQVGAGADGVVTAVYVQEGQFVQKGALLGEIGCDDLKAELQTAVAVAKSARESRVRLLRGARKDEKRIAAQKTAAARAVFAQAKSILAMERALYEKDEISRSKFEVSERDAAVAHANLDAAILAQHLLALPPLPEDVARANAEVAAAEGRVQTVQAEIAKCAIVAPIQGTILRVDVDPGESFSTVTPRPLFEIADTSGRRVKAEVDAEDVGRLTLGQRVIVQVDPLGSRSLVGRVASISPAMQRTQFDTGDPSDVGGHETLEVFIQFENEPPLLPIGLRVTVQFLAPRAADRQSGTPAPVAGRP